MIDLVDSLNPNNNRTDINNGYILDEFVKLLSLRAQLFSTLLVMANKAGARAWWSRREYNGELCNQDSEEWCIGCIEVNDERDICFYFNINDVYQSKAFKALELSKAAWNSDAADSEDNSQAINDLLDKLDHIAEFRSIKLE